MKKLITFLYERYCKYEADLESMKKPVSLDKLSKDEQEALFRRCKFYAEDDLLEWLAETLVARIEHDALYEVSHIPIQTTESRIHLERINGIGDFVDHIKMIASMSEQEEEAFDKHEPL